MCDGYFHYSSIFWYFTTSGISWGCASDVSSLIVPMFILKVSLFLGATAEILLGWVFIAFMGSPVEFSMGVPYRLVPLKVLHG